MFLFAKLSTDMQSKWQIFLQVSNFATGLQIAKSQRARKDTMCRACFGGSSTYTWDLVLT